MTEQEWLTLDRVNTPHMNWLRRRGSSRKFFLVAAGFARQVEDKITHPLYRELIALVEGYADDLIPEHELSRRMRLAEEDRIERSFAMHRNGTIRRLRKGLSADSTAVRAATPPDGWMAAINALGDASGAGKRKELGPRQMELLREIFGNPFRPVNFNELWRTSTVIALARGMYESRDFSAMPILADALMDAGCDNIDILNHCRQSGQHSLGCWVLDLCLGKV
jgi:hypothetical protein